MKLGQISFNIFYFIMTALTSAHWNGLHKNDTSPNFEID